MHHHFRPEEHAFWIDSMGMDPVDNAEKSAQVAMMGKIYENAALVAACIGTSDVLAHLHSFPEARNHAEIDWVIARDGYNALLSSVMDHTGNCTSGRRYDILRHR
jgi:hypothetical protein